MDSKKTIQQLLEFSILNIDKPSGPTSFNISDIVRRKLGLRKTSHFGTLDPKVTGVLPIALNRACKLTGHFLKKDKEYVGIMRIHKDIELNKLKLEIKKFVGKIIQKPPVKSRVKREERERQIYKFEILEKQGQNILFKVECQAGTYIRKLISDLGLKISGAHMLELRRTWAGIFKETDDEFVNLYGFEKAVQDYKKGDEEKLRKILIPAEEAIKKIFPTIQIKKDSVRRLLTGKPIFKQDLEKEIKLEKNKSIGVFDEDRFIGIYKIINEKEIIAKPEFVLQDVGN